MNDNNKSREELIRELTELRRQNAALQGMRSEQERLKAEKVLMHSEERFRTIFEEGPIGMIVSDNDYKIMKANKAFCEITGYSQEEVVGMGIESITFPEDREISKKLSGQLFAGEIPRFRLEKRYIRKDGESIWVNLTASAIRTEDGKQFYGLGMMEDITERRRAEEALRQSEAFIRTILDTVDEGFAVIDRDFRIMTANKAYCRQVGGCEEEIIGCHCYQISHKTSRPCFEEGEECAVRQVFETGVPHTALHRHADPAGNLLYVETKAYPIRDAAGEISSAVETITNITEKLLLEEERLKMQKLEAIGVLAGGIAHDFNNLLQGIFGYISLAKMALDRKESSFAMLEQAERALHMTVNLTTQLLTFSKGGKPAKRIMHLRGLIENAAKFALSGSRSEYRIMLDEDLWPVEIDEGQIGQVIQNIVLNADQAMPEGGAIEITAKNVSPPAARTHYKLLGPGRHVEISIRDTGVGIAEKYLRKVFDPYFTTKEKGSGLGLATCYSIIRNHGGVITVASEVGKGTIFYIYLPAVEEAREMEERPAAAPVAGKAKVLVMDDEDIIQDIARDMLKTLGHKADFSRHGKAAIKKYRAAMEAGRPYDIVILDLTIRGGMGGRETVEQLLTIDPGVRAIVSSGYSENKVVSEYGKYGFKARLSKPYRLDDLRDVINTLLGGPATA